MLCEFPAQNGEKVFVETDIFFNYLKRFFHLSLEWKCCIVGSGPFSLPQRVIFWTMALTLELMENLLLAALVVWGG
jgi:hypothetical protein